MTKSWSPTTVYETFAIIKITTHARSYLIKSDRSSDAFYEVKTIVTHDYIDKELIADSHASLRHVLGCTERPKLLIVSEVAKVSDAH